MADSHLSYEADEYFLEAYDAYLYAYYDFAGLAHTVAKLVDERDCWNILDCTAGIGGDLALELRANGLKIDCSDPSPLMVERFKRAAGRYDVNDQCRIQSWDALSHTGKTYDYAICQSNSLVYGPSWDGGRVVGIEEIRQYLSNFADIIRPGGYLHLDAPWQTDMQPKSSAIQSSQKTEFELPGIGKLEKTIISEQIRELPDSRLWECAIKVYPLNDSPVRTYNIERHSSRLTIHDLPQLLRESGFGNIQLLQLPGNRSIHGTIIAQKSSFRTPERVGRDDRRPIALPPAGISDKTTVAVVSGGPTEDYAATADTALAVTRSLGKLGFRPSLYDANDTASLIPGIKGVDLVFNAIQGAFGEDGSLTATCEMLGTPVTGPRSAVHSICFDKALFKAWASQHGIMVPPETLRAMPMAQSQKAIIKPRKNSGSNGLEFLQSDKTSLLSLTPGSLYERYVPGRIISACVFGRLLDPARLPLLEVHSESGVHTRAQKRGQADVRYELLWGPGDKAENYIQSESGRLYQSLEANGLLQFDWIIPADGSDPVLLECNTNPELKPYGICSLITTAAGISYENLIEQIMADAFSH